MKSASLLSDVVGHAIVAHTDHDAAAVKGHYRLLESAEDSEVRPENILAPHRARTIERMRSQKEVLFIQDGTKLNYATRPACEGLQIIGSNQTKAKTRGLPLHVTMAATADGLPLGVLRCSWRDPQTGPLAPRSQQWLDGYLDICQAAEGLSRKSRLICIMDREADNFALFDAQRRQGRVEMLVRVRQDRVLAKGRKMYATLRSAPVACTLQIEIQSVTARPKSSRKKERVGRSYRMAHAEVRFQRLELRATQKDMDPVTMYGVHVRETAPPPGQKPVEWYLLTSMDLPTAADGETVISWVCRMPRHGIGELELGGLFVYFYAVLLWGCFQHTDEQLRSSQPPPALLRFPGQLVNHHQCRLPAAASLGLPCTFPCARKRGLNGIRSPKMNPVFGRELVEGQELLLILAQTGDGLLVGASEEILEGIECLQGILPGRCRIDATEPLFRRPLQLLGQLTRHVGCLVHPASLL